MRSRLLTGAVALALAVGGLLVPASPASAHCDGHSVHRDEYNGGGIFWGNGTAIRQFPHRACTIIGRGFPGEGINVHCAILNLRSERVWLFVRDLDDGTRGWAEEGALRIPNPKIVHDCTGSEFIFVSG